MHDQIFASVQDVVRGVFNNPRIALTKETTAADVTEWTSLNHINLIVALEQKFDVTFDLGEVEDLRNIGELVGLIAEKRTH